MQWKLWILQLPFTLGKGCQILIAGGYFLLFWKQQPRAVAFEEPTSHSLRWILSCRKATKVSNLQIRDFHMFSRWLSGFYDVYYLLFQKSLIFLHEKRLYDFTADGGVAPVTWTGKIRKRPSWEQLDGGGWSRCFCSWDVSFLPPGSIPAGSPGDQTGGRPTPHLWSWLEIQVPCKICGVWAFFEVWCKRNGTPKYPELIYLGEKARDLKASQFDIIWPSSI